MGVLLSVFFFILYFLILFRVQAHQVAVTVAYICCWLTAFLVLATAYCRIGQPNGVPLGLLANFFLQGGVMGLLFAMLLNTLMLGSWQVLSHDCNPMTIMMTFVCNVEAALEWILTPGLIEETFKSLWLFFRLR